MKWIDRHNWVIRHCLPLIIFSVVALAPMYPVVVEPRSRVRGWSGDNVQYVYMTGWTAQALALNRSPFVDPRLNYPDALYRPSQDAPYLSMFAVAPATLLFGPTFGYNLIVYLSSLLSAYFAYLWVLKLTGSRLGGVVAGLAFLLAPVRVAAGYGHLNRISTQMLPLFFWSLDNALELPSPSYRALLTLAGATFLVGSMSQYYLVISLLAGGVYMILSALPRPAYLLRYGWLFLVGTGAGAIVSAAIYLNGWSDRRFVPYSIHDTRFWSSSVLDFVVPSRLHPLWGTLVERVYPRPTWIEHTTYLGFIPCALALVALLLRNRPNTRRNRVCCGVIISAIVLSLGTDLHVNGQPLQPNALVWLPAYYLGQLPFMNLVRAWSRFSIIASLLIALLAGLGAAQLVSRSYFQKWLVGTVLCGHADA